MPPRKPDWQTEHPASARRHLDHRARRDAAARDEVATATPLRADGSPGSLTWACRTEAGTRSRSPVSLSRIRIAPTAPGKPCVPRSRTQTVVPPPALRTDFGPDDVFGPGRAVRARTRVVRADASFDFDGCRRSRRIDDVRDLHANDGSPWIASLEGGQGLTTSSAPKCRSETTSLGERPSGSVLLLEDARSVSHALVGARGLAPFRHRSVFGLGSVRRADGTSRRRVGRRRRPAGHGRRWERP
jgi:hypothetical protein